MAPWNEAKKQPVHIERDSIIQFYNHVFLPLMKPYLARQKDEVGGAAPQAPGLMQPPASSPRFQRTLQVGSPLRGKTSSMVGPSPGTRALVAIGESPMQQQEFAQINSRLRAQRRGRPERLSFEGAEAAQQEKRHGGDN